MTRRLSIAFGAISLLCLFCLIPAAHGRTAGLWVTSSTPVPLCNPDVKVCSAIVPTPKNYSR